MADNEEKESIVAKFGGWFGIILAIVAGLFFLDQGEIFGETVPAAWTRLGQVLTRGGEKVKQTYWRCAIMVRDHLKSFRRLSYFWWAISALFLVAGMWGKTHGWSENASLALRLIGIYLFAGYWFVVAMLAKPLYYGMHALRKGAYVAAKAVGKSANHWLGKLGIETPVPEVTATDAKKLEEGANAFQRFFFTILGLTLILGTFFAPSGEAGTAVKLALIGMPLAALAAVAAKHGWKSESGWKLIGVAVLIGFVVLTLTVFGETLIPASIRHWFSARNASELVAMTLAVIPCVFWMLGAFWTSKSAAINKVAKYLSYASGALLIFLLFKGAINYHDLTGHEKPKVVDRLEQKLDSIGSTTSSSAPSRTGAYLSPPGGSASTTASQSTPAPQVTPKTHGTRTKIIIPPAEPPKQYTNPVQAIDDLDKLGY